MDYGWTESQPRYSWKDVIYQLFSGVNINIGIFEKLFVFLTDQLGSLPTYSLSIGHLCSSYICWEGLPWTVDSCRDYKHVFWTSQSDGKVWPTSRQIHGLLSAVPWWCSTQGCECSYCDNQDQENHSVCGLVSNWLQGVWDFIDKKSLCWL